VADAGPLTIDQRKPAVSILIVQPVPGEIIEHILWGLEEEGIPYEIVAHDGGVAEVMAKQAAVRSRLNVGIGVNGAEDKAVLHHRDLPEEKPLFTLRLGPVQAQMDLRTLGVNAARLVKGEPLVFNDEPLRDSRSRGCPAPLSADSDGMAEIIAKVLMEFLDKK
jgi:hypothetical protein